MLFDPASPQGAAARHRLETETLGWLTTAYPDGRLAASLIWFLWIDEELLIYSRDNTKVRNIEANPNVAFNLNSDDRGGSVLTLAGRARIDRDYPPSSAIDAYQAKYTGLIARLGTTPDGFAADYSVAVRIEPISYRSF